MPALVTAKIVEGYRPIPEDRAEVIPVASGLVLVVADGAGGRAGGERAAEMAVGAVREAAPTFRKIHDPRAWGRLLGQIDQMLLDDPEAGETTAVVAALSCAGIAGASVGDSGAWLITPDGWGELTEGQHPKPCLGTGAGKVLGHRVGLTGDRLLSYAEARRAIYLPSCRWVLENRLPDLLGELRDVGAAGSVLLLDFEKNCDIDDLSRPLSHAGLVKRYLEGDWPA